MGLLWMIWDKTGGDRMGLSWDGLWYNKTSGDVIGFLGM
jgi:hypothetical protein